jgi:glycosyltransferase involved in cell wall biosynthesis
MQQTLLSIVIPTKNRYEYLNILIKTLLKFEYRNFEIIVQDNSADNSSFLEFSKDISDDRLKYFYDNDSSFSSIENCDAAFLNAKGKYICFIGDDDGIVPQLFDFVEWMDKNQIEAANFKKASYIWPDVTFKYYGKGLSGKLTFNTSLFEITKIDIRKEYEKLLSLGAQEITNIPRTYHGVVEKKCLDALYNKAGTYFPGPVPDMANAVGLIGYVNTLVYASLPFVISGQGANSMGGKGAQKKHHGRIEDEKSLPANTSELWSKQIPKFWSAPTIWSEATIKACEATNKIGDVNKLNFAYIFATCICFEYRYIKEIIRTYLTGFSFVKQIEMFFLIPVYILKLTLYRIKVHSINLTKAKNSAKGTIEGVEDIQVAIQMVNDGMEKNLLMSKLENEKFNI